jgi:hypothetical protein
MFLVLSLSV